MIQCNFLFRGFTLLIFLHMLAAGACTSEREVLIEGARKGNAATRIKAIEKLAGGKWDERVENTVVDALTDASSLVREAAAKALAGRGMPVAWPLVRRLRDADPRVRVQVVKSLHTLPAADFVVVALMRTLEDPAQAVRREVVEGFRKRGWRVEDILAWQAFERRMRALEGLAAPAAMDRAAGLEELGRLRTPADLGFLLAALSHSDPFLVQIAAKSLARGGETEMLDRVLAAGGPEPETLLAAWLEAAPKLDRRTMDVLARNLPRETLTETLLRRNWKLPCSELANLADPELVAQVEDGCPVDPAWPLPLRFAYLKRQGRADAGLEKEALARLEELPASALRLLAADPATAPQVVLWAKKSWERYVFEYQKWIPDRTWQAMDLVAPTEDSGIPKPPANDVSRLLDAYRSRATAVDEHELFMPEFDVERFARQLNSLSGVASAREIVDAMLAAAPAPLLAAALRVLATLVKPGEKLPQVVMEAADSPEPAVQDAAFAVLAAAGEAKELLSRLESANPQQADFILSKLERTQEPAVQEELRRLFSRNPMARLALALARLGSPGIRDEILSLLAEDTVPELAGERALLLSALSLAGERDETFLRAVDSGLWYPAPVVRCRALSFAPGETRAIWAKAAPEWEVRRCASEIADKEK